MPLAADQRYCLECGERAASTGGRSLPLPAPAGAGPEQAPGHSPSVPPPAQPPGMAPVGEQPSRGNTLLVIAGVGVLMLAMGVGVLIGRSGASTPTQAAAPQVITVAGTGAGSSAGTGEAAFTGDWPSGTSGYAVQLQTLPQTGTTISAVEAAKTAATGKGAPAVGALKSEEFTSLTSGSYVIYSGVDHTRAAAEKALGALRKNFPAARVITVSNGSSSASEGGSSSGASGAGKSLSKPAPAAVLHGLSTAKGKSYEEKSKNLPNVVETG
jgi:hypothetical protein